MRPTLTELRSWATQSIIDSAGPISTDATTIGDSISMAALVLDRATWRGGSRTGADQVLTTLRDRGTQLRNILLRIADETADAGADLHGRRERILSYVADIQAAGYRVSDTGVVTHPDESTGRPPRATRRRSITDSMHWTRPTSSTDPPWRP